MKINQLIYFLVGLFSIASIYSCDDDSSSSNKNPTCTITSPEEGSEIGLGFIIDIKADAEDPDGQISEVRFYIDDNGVGSSESFPYTFEWNTSDYSVGTHTIKVKAFDNEGGSSSDEITINIITNSSITDSRDGQTYKTILIGEQWWMAENLNYDAGNNSWEYENNSNYGDIYGRLYNWETACDVCPDGWHLPNDDEWKELEKYLGMSSVEASDYNYRGTNEGGLLKEEGTTHWNEPNFGATNESGFSALPGGARSEYNQYFYELGYSAYFWTSTENGSFYAFYRALNYEVSTIYRSTEEKKDGFSVRCIKD